MTERFTQKEVRTMMSGMHQFQLFSEGAMPDKAVGDVVSRLRAAAERSDKKLDEVLIMNMLILAQAATSQNIHVPTALLNFVQEDN